MNRAALFAFGLALGGAAWWCSRRQLGTASSSILDDAFSALGNLMGSSRNVKAFGELVKRAEANGDYTVIAGGDRFDDFSEHPFIVNPNRPKPLGTTASGAYQMVRQTWTLARDALQLPDFSPESQDKAFEFLLRYKVPGKFALAPEGTGIYELVEAGEFDEAIAQLGLEWEAFAKMAAGRYSMSLDEARALIESEGGVYA